MFSFTQVDVSQLGTSNAGKDAGEVFPHAILHIRWEFSRMPEVVRLFDTSHLVERVQDFSLEKAAVFTICKGLTQPRWRQALDTDIRRVPVALRRNRIRSREIATATSSGPSSTEGANDSVFSAGGAAQSSATSLEQSPSMSHHDSSAAEASKSLPEISGKNTKKKRARIVAQSPPVRSHVQQRYWNEFDDGDSDVNQEESYAIYIDPNEPSFPGAETVSKVFGSMYDSLSRGKHTVASWLPIKSRAESQAEWRADTPSFRTNKEAELIRCRP